MTGRSTSDAAALVLVLLLVASIASVGLAGTAMGDTRVGGSGNCDDGSDDNDYIEGGGDGGELRSGGGDAPDSGGFFLAILNLVQERSVPEDEDMCDGILVNRSGDDYFEVHAEGGGHGVQYCLSDQNDEQGGEVHRHDDPGYDSGDCAYDEDGEHS